MYENVQLAIAQGTVDWDSVQCALSFRVDDNIITGSGNLKCEQ